MLSNQRIQNLDESLNKLLESRQKKIEVLEATLKDVRNDNASLKQNMEVQKLKSGGNNQVMEIQLKTVVTERDELRADLAKVYIFLEKIEFKISNTKTYMEIQFFLFSMLEISIFECFVKIFSVED